ncbi:MAG: hypothetical protein IKO20_01650 [Bacteroidaceae bacterium]|nr:hypothetical protein [Bacteroidaceae bacterium]
MLAFSGFFQSLTINFQAQKINFQAQKINFQAQTVDFQREENKLSGLGVEAEKTFASKPKAHGEDFLHHLQ